MQRERWAADLRQNDSARCAHAARGCMASESAGGGAAHRSELSGVSWQIDGLVASRDVVQ
jgi:DNA-binding transcriptional regulator YdaS (Cro superfamily)